MTTQLSEDYLLFLNQSKSDAVRLAAFIRYNEQDILTDREQLAIWEPKKNAVSEIMVEFFTKSIESSQRAIERAKKCEESL